MRKKIALLLVLCLVLSCFAGCGSSDSEDVVSISINAAFEGNAFRTIVYNQSSPLTLEDGSVVTAGMLKPFWSITADILGIDITFTGSAGQTAPDMIDIAATTGFNTATIYAGNTIASDLVNYGAQGYFVNLAEVIEEGKMPNFAAYLEENPTIKTAISAYDGGIYHVPYTAEIGNAARVYVLYEPWVTDLLDIADTSVLDTSYELTVYYEGFYVGDNVRYGEYGGSVNPIDDVIITKQTDQSIIEIQNNLSVQNGQTLTAALITYIEDNYDYENPSDLFISTEAAYDIDEMIALWRCIKANAEYLTDGQASTVWPFFTRYASYREEIIRLMTYWDGTRVHSSDAYTTSWAFDENGELYYTYYEEDFYDGLVLLSQLNAEGMFYPDSFDETNTSNLRTILFDNVSSGAYTTGFMQFDFIGSTTAETLNDSALAVYPPVAEINGVWQYFIENTRAIKSDGWSISAAATDEQIDAALALFDYMYSEEGHIAQNYGYSLDEDSVLVGPDGTEYPAFSEWAINTSIELSGGDMSQFLRDYYGAQLAIGYEKEMGMELSTTTQAGLDAWEMVENSNIVFGSYAGDETLGENPYYSMMIPPVFSLTTRQVETINDSTTVETDIVQEVIFNVIQYQALGNAPSGSVVPSSYAEYKAYWDAAGIETYVSTYNAAYAAMQG